MADYSIETAGARSPRRAALLDVLVIVIAGAALLMTPPPDAGAVIAQLMVPLRMLGLCLLATFLLRRRGLTWAAVGVRRPASRWRVAGLVVAGYVTLAVFSGLLMAFVLPALGQRADSSAAAFASIEGQVWKYVSWLLVAWTSAAIGEELLFRGFLQSRLEGAFGGSRWALVAALIVQAVLFGFAHGYQGLGGVVLTASAGLVLGGVRLAGRGNLVACMLLHALIDTVSLTAVFLGVLSMSPGA